MSTPALNQLVEKVRAKYPGSYDDMDDAALTKAVLAKYPQYSDLAAPAVSKPQVQMNGSGLSFPEKVGANLADAAEHVKPYVQQAANDVYDVSAPGIATEIYKKLQGLPNKLHELPGKMVQGFFAAAGVPEAKAEAAIPEIPAKFPGAPLPEAPTPELVKAQPLAHGPQQVIDPAAGLGKVPVKSAPVYPGAPNPTATAEQINPSLVSPARTMPGQIAAEQIAPTGPIPGVTARPSLDRITPPRQGLMLQGEVQAYPAVQPEAAPIPKPIKPTVLQQQIEQGLGNQPLNLKPNVPLREQLPSVKPQGDIPEGHTPVQSSAVKSYKYDADAKEFHARPSTGSTTYVYGDVTPEEADAFAKADSKGKAWMQIRNNPLVAKIVNGKRIPVKPVSEGEDLTGILQQSVDQAKAARATAGND